MLKIFLLMLLVSGLSACGIGGGALPQDHFYKLPELAINAQATSRFVELVIKPVKATGLYHDRAILYIEQEYPLELKRYHYSFWSETPADLIQGALYQGLSSSGIAQRVNRKVTESQADYIIDTRIVSFERVINGDAVTVKVILDIRVHSGHDASNYWVKRYTSTQVINTTAMYPSVEAFGVAVEEICTQLITDLLVKK